MHKFRPSDLPRGPNGECRPSDPIALAAAVVCIATGESDEATETALALAEERIEVISARRVRTKRSGGNEL